MNPYILSVFEKIAEDHTVNNWKSKRKKKADLKYYRKKLELSLAHETAINHGRDYRKFHFTLKIRKLSFKQHMFTYFSKDKSTLLILHFYLHDALKLSYKLDVCMKHCQQSGLCINSVTVSNLLVNSACLVTSEQLSLQQ